MKGVTNSMSKKTEEKKSPEQEMAESKAKLEALIAKRNEHALFAEYKSVKKVDEEIDKELKAYRVIALAERIRELAGADDPMMELIKTRTFSAIDTKTVKNDEGAEQVELTSKDFLIDPLDLHKRTPDGIGKDHLWPYIVERINVMRMAATAKELGLDAKKVKDTIAMKEETRKLTIEGDKSSTDKAFLADIQKAVDAMVGTGYEVKPDSVAFVRNAFTRYKKSMTISNALPKTTRQIALDVCAHVVLGTPYAVEYKEKKNK